MSVDLWLARCDKAISILLSAQRIAFVFVAGMMFAVLVMILAYVATGGR